MRLNKYISQTGYCSLREADKLIDSKKITINGEKTSFNLEIKENDVVLIEGRQLPKPAKKVYLAFNKPIGITCTSEKNIADNIIDFINYPERIFPVGRLDKDSEGLILLTNDGDLSNKILDGSKKNEKEYIVTLEKPITNRFKLAQLSTGVTLPELNVTTQPCEVEQIDPKTLKIVLTQGLNRQIRRMIEAIGYNVTALKRVRIMNIKLDTLETGKWRDLTEEERKGLVELLG